MQQSTTLRKSFIPFVMASLSAPTLLILFLHALAFLATADRCDHLHASEEAKEAYNKQLIIDFYREGFTNPHQNLANAVRNYVVAHGYIQHNPFTADGRDALIVTLEAIYGNSRANPIDFVAKIAADGDLVWVHEKRTSPNTGSQTAVVNIYRLDCGEIVEHWDTIQPISARAVYANKHPYF